MNAQEQQLITELFDRLSKLEQAPRDTDAESAIRDGQRRAPNAVYALVQTVLVQDEALKRANAHIEQLEAQLRPQAVQSGSFLDSMRDALFGSRQNSGSVPDVRPQDASRSDPTRPIWNGGQVNAQVNAQTDPRYAGGPGYGYGTPYGSTAYGGGGSFLGTAAAAAAGVIGGSLLMGGIRNLMGGHQAFADPSAFGTDNRAPWTDQSDSTLAHDAGIDDIGRSERDDDNSRQGMFDQASNEDNYGNDNYSNNDDDDFNGDGDGFDSGDSDIA